MLRYRYHTSWGKEVREFHARFLELRRKEDWNERMTQMRKVAWILQRFPNSDEKGEFCPQEGACKIPIPK